MAIDVRILRTGLQRLFQIPHFDVIVVQLSGSLGHTPQSRYVPRIGLQQLDTRLQRRRPILIASRRSLLARRQEIKMLLPAHWNGELSMAGAVARVEYVRTLWDGIGKDFEDGKTLGEAGERRVSDPQGGQDQQDVERVDQCQDPSSPGLSRAAREGSFSSLPTGTPFTCRMPPKLVCTSTPTV